MVANAVVHYDEASPHMHVVGVPVGKGFKRGLTTKVSKRSVFTQDTLSKDSKAKIDDKNNDSNKNIVAIKFQK